MADAADDDELARAIAMSLQPYEASAASTTYVSGASLQPSPRSSAAKRRKSDEECDEELVLAAPGEARRVRLGACVQSHRQRPAITLEHGSSLALISKATSVLNQEFTEMDPEADWAKWQALGATIYFFVVAEEGDPSRAPCCVLRTVLDGDFSTADSDGFACLSQGTRDSPSASCARRVVVDYLFTAEAARGKGHAARLLECAREMSRRSAANLLVLAIEESCPYWVQQGFILDDGPINKRINRFPDTHLLKLPTNRPDSFPAAVSSSSEEEDEAKGGEEQEEEKEEEEDDQQLQQALIASMLPAIPAPVAPAAAAQIDLTAGDSDSDDEEEESGDSGENAELQRAISLSLDDGGTAAAAHDDL